jgi:hypothetical protein
MGTKRALVSGAEPRGRRAGMEARGRRRELADGGGSPRGGDCGRGLEWRWGGRGLGVVAGVWGAGRGKGRGGIWCGCWHGVAGSWWAVAEPVAVAGNWWRWRGAGGGGGELADDSEWAGIGIFDATHEDTARIMADDPAVHAGVLSYEVHPVRGFPGDGLPPPAD